MLEGSSGPDSTALLGGKQLWKAIYRAIKNAIKASFQDGSPLERLIIDLGATS